MRETGCLIQWGSSDEVQLYVSRFVCCVGRVSVLGMIHLLLVALGGGIGAALRYLSVETAARLFGAGFPVGTLFVNVIGSGVMGLAAAWLIARGANEPVRLFLAVGILGGFTTFSAFSLDAIRLLQAGSVWPFAGYIVGSVAASLGALVIGLWAGRFLFPVAS